MSKESLILEFYLHSVYRIRVVLKHFYCLKKLLETWFYIGLTWAYLNSIQWYPFINSSLAGRDQLSPLGLQAHREIWQATYKHNKAIFFAVHNSNHKVYKQSPPCSNTQQHGLTCFQMPGSIKESTTAASSRVGPRDIHPAERNPIPSSRSHSCFSQLPEALPWWEGAHTNLVLPLLTIPGRPALLTQKQTTLLPS